MISYTKTTPWALVLIALFFNNALSMQSLHNDNSLIVPLFYYASDNDSLKNPPSQPIDGYYRFPCPIVNESINVSLYSHQIETTLLMNLITAANKKADPVAINLYKYAIHAEKYRSSHDILALADKFSLPSQRTYLVPSFYPVNNNEDLQKLRQFHFITGFYKYPKCTNGSVDILLYQKTMQAIFTINNEIAKENGSHADTIKRYDNRIGVEIFIESYNLTVEKNKNSLLN